MIRDLDETLKQLLIRHTPLDPSQVEVNFEIPDREWSTGLAKPTINLYLYDIRENRELRETDWAVEPNGSGGRVRRRSPVRIDLAYLITAWTRAVEDEHHLLWAVLETLIRNPELPHELLQGELKKQIRPVRLATARGDGVLKDPADFWAALDNQLKPSVNLVATVELDRKISVMAPPVAEVSIRTEPIEPRPKEPIPRRRRPREEQLS